MIIKPQSKIKGNENGLYIVSTPIGNLKDITLRAVEILKKSDFILCEDTRISKNLLNKYQIKSKLISNHKFNEKTNIFKIIEYLKSGKIISLISDAGTPGISDPGSVLVNECVKNNIKIIPIPGASAVATAISISGFSDKFFFYGFLPDKKKQIITDLKKLSEFTSAIVFFVSPKKINKIIPEIKKYFNDRKLVICREITKLYEEFIRVKVDELKEFEKEPRGEITVVISEKKIEKINSKNLSESDINIIDKVINKLTIKEITDLICQNSKVSKKQVYNYCLKVKMKIKLPIIIFIGYILSGCVGVGSSGLFGTGVSVALDPRTLGTQIDDSIMQKSLTAKILAKDKKYFLSVKSKVIDGRIFITGKVDGPEEKLQITKIAWETKGTRSVRNDLKVKEEFNFKQSAKDVLITSQLRTALIVNKNIKATNYQIDTYKKKIYVYGIALTSEEKDLVISEAKEILDVENVIASIMLVEDLRIQKE